MEYFHKVQGSSAKYLETLAKILHILIFPPTLESVDKILLSLFKSVQKKNNTQNKQQFCLQLLCYCLNFHRHHYFYRVGYWKTKGIETQDVILLFVA